MNSLHALQSQFRSARERLSPVLRESKFKEHGRITPEEFICAGDFLTYKFPVWTWEKGESSKAKDYLQPDKQYLLTRGVPCLRRATSLAYTDADEDAERMLSFAIDPSSKEDEWVQTHAGRPAPNDLSNAQNIDDIPDLDGVIKDVDNLNLNRGGNSHAAPAAVIPDMDDIPDMEEEGLEGGDDEATAAAPPPVPPKEKATNRDNLLQVRTYDVMITYDKYYQTPRIWLLGYDEKGTPLNTTQVFQDVSADHAFKTVTIEAFPHSSSLSAASVHPCKHASVMKKVIERMNAGVAEATNKEKEKRTWLGGAFKKVTGPGPAATSPGADDDGDGMKVDFYLVVFLKFIASIVPTIEIDSTAAF